MLFEGSGLFCVFFWKKWTFFACFREESGPFCVHFLVKVDFFARFLFGGKWTILPKIVDHFGLFGPKWWTILDTLGPWGVWGVWVMVGVQGKVAFGLSHFCILSFSKKV